MHGISTLGKIPRMQQNKAPNNSMGVLIPPDFYIQKTSKDKPLRGPLRARHYGINLSPRASARCIFFVPGRDLLVVGVWSFRPPLKVEDRLTEVGIRGKEL